MLGRIDSFFGLTARQSTLYREIVAGCSTYLSLCYIFIVNPAILHGAHMDVSAVLFATALASGITTIAMGLWAKLPFAVAPGLEMNGLFALVAVAAMGLTWQQALGATLLSGVGCAVIAASPLFPRVMSSIPSGLKSNIGVSVGVFVAMTGLYLAKILIFARNGTPDFSSWSPAVLVSSRAIVLYVGLALAFVLSRPALKFNLSFLLSIIVCVVLCAYFRISAGSPAHLSSRMFSAAFHADVVSGLGNARFWQVSIVLLIITLFGALGKSIGLTAATNLQAEGYVEGVERAVITNGAGSVLGAVTGTSGLIIYVESAVGIASGGRTGLTAVVVGILMLASVPFTFVVGIVPVEATAGVLVFVGYLLLPVRQWRDPASNFGRFDAMVAAGMAILSFITFGLDKAMLFGFWMYSARNLLSKAEKNDYLLFGFSVALLLSSVFELGLHRVWLSGI